MDRSASATVRITPLALMVPLLFFAGCSQADDNPSEYQEFNSLEIEEESPIDDNNVASNKSTAEGMAFEPLVAPKAMAIDGGISNEWTPLVAVKPIFADSLAGMKDNIENNSATRGELREVKLLIPENSFKVEGPEQALRISYDDFDLLKILNMEPVPENAVNHFPGWLRALDGKRVRVRGFMYPPFREEGLEQFVLARDNQICCFGRNPKIYDLVHVSMRDNVTTNYIQNRPFDVVGVFHIHPDYEGGEWYGLYELSDAIVLD